MFYWGAARGARRLVRPARRPVAVAAPGRARAWPRVARVALAVSSSAPCGSSLQALSVALFGLVWVSALFGDTDPFRNLAPTWIYVIFWLGVPALSVVLGNVWRALSPWRAIADAFVWARELGGGEAQASGRVPGEARPLAGGRGAARVRRPRARLLGPGEPACARVRDRAVHVRRALRDGRVRAGHVGGERGGLRRPVPAARQDRPASTWWTGGSASAGR